MLNITIVGSIDHGKSTLIGRLLYDTNSLPEGKLDEIKKTCEELGRKLEFAYICDALEEERKNQMTIETMQTFFRANNKEYAIIDAPGHKEFLKNMVTGVSQADASILIIDAKEGIQEQTKRHAYLLKLLGISNLIIAINKMDLVNYEEKIFKQIKNEINSFLNEIEISPSFIIPISAYEGDNVVKKSEKMQWYKGLTILDALNNLKKSTTIYDFRMPIQDVYEVNNKKVYVGNILSGEVKKGEIVKVFPNNKEVKIKEILISNSEIKSAKAPMAIGIITNEKLKRGNVLTKGKKPLVLKKISPLIFCLIGEITENEKYTLRCVTQEVECKINKIIEKIDINTLERLESHGKLKETDIGKIEISLKKPIVMEKFNELKELGRFVLLKKGEIIAGGILM